MLSCAANRLFAAYVWLALDVAAPWRVYRLKSRGMQSEFEFQRMPVVPGKSEFAFGRHSLLQEHTLMMRPKSAISAVTPKTLIGLSLLLLILAAIFGLLNSHKVKTLRTNVANADAARDAAEHRGAVQQRNPETRETAVAGAEAKIAEAQKNAAKA